MGLIHPSTARRSSRTTGTAGTIRRYRIRVPRADDKLSRNRGLVSSIWLRALTRRAYTIPYGTKFATLNLAPCAVAGDVSDPLTLAHDITIHHAPLFKLGGDFEAEIGTRNAEQFKGSNLVLMASRASVAPTIRDAEWQELDHRVLMMFYAILMHGIVEPQSAPDEQLQAIRRAVHLYVHTITQVEQHAVTEASHRLPVLDRSPIFGKTS